MKFKNITDDALVVPALGVTIEVGGELVVTADETAGFVSQAGGNWEPADDDAHAAVNAALAEQPAEPHKAPVKRTAAKETKA